MINQVDNDIAVLAILGRVLVDAGNEPGAISDSTATGRRLGRRGPEWRGSLGAGSVSISFMLETVFSSPIIPR